MSVWSDAWTAAADLAARCAAVGASASKVRDVPARDVRIMREFFDLLKRASPAAFNECICEHAQHAANGIAEIVGLQAEVEVARANRPVDDDDPTPVMPATPPPPEAKGEP